MPKLILLVVCLYASASAFAQCTLVINPVSGQLQCTGGSGGGGSTNPGGANTAVQYNSSNLFGGDATNFFYNASTHSLGVTGALSSANFTVTSLADIQSAMNLTGPSVTTPMASTFLGLKVNQFSMNPNLACGLGLCWPDGSIWAAVDAPSSASGAGSLGQGYAAYMGFSRSSGSFTWPGTAGSANAVFRGECFVGGASAATWCETTQATDYNQSYLNAGATSFAATGVHGYEQDLVIGNAGTQRAANFFLVNNSTVQAVQYHDGILMESEVGSTCGPNKATACTPWKVGIQMVGGSANVAALIGETAISASQNSMAIEMVGRDASNTQQIGAYAVDNNGGLLFNAANNGVTTTPVETILKNGSVLRQTGSLGTGAFRDTLYSYNPLANLSSGTSTAWTAAQFAGNIIQVATAGSLTFTTPTATQIINQIQVDATGAFVNENHATYVINPASATQTYTVAAGVGITMVPSTFTLAPGQTAVLQSYVSNVGTPAVSIVVHQSAIPVLPSTTTATTQAADDNSTKVATTAYVDRTVTRIIGFQAGTPGGSALSTGVLGYYTIPFACTITGWSIQVDTGTATVKTLKVAAGTAIPTLGSNSISTSGVSISTGTVVQSATVTDFTTTAVAANDIVAADLITSGSPGYIAFQLVCKQ